jgi:hypothetical protein
MLAHVKRGDATLDAEGNSRSMVTNAWHSIKQSVHHNNTACNTGNNIETENRREGSGNRPLCSECAKIA